MIQWDLHDDSQDSIRRIEKKSKRKPSSTNRDSGTIPEHRSSMSFLRREENKWECSLMLIKNSQVKSTQENLPRKVKRVPQLIVK